MILSRSISLRLCVTVLSVASVLIASSWFHIQSLRLSYLVESLQSRRDAVARADTAVTLHLRGALSLDRLEETGIKKFHLAVPQARQIVYVVKSPDRRNSSFQESVEK